MPNHRPILLLLFLLMMGPAAAQTVRFPDQWRVRAEDRQEFSSPTFDERNWSSIWIPSQLQQEGFEFPRGVNWFRVRFDVPERWVGHPLTLVMGKVDAADQTFLNGRLVGSMGKFPPQEKTAWSETRFYPIPAGCLQRHNVLALRLFHSGVLGGITDGPIGFYSEADLRKEFHPAAGARTSLTQLVTSNGRTVAVYDREQDFLPFVLPHVFQSYRQGKQVKAVMRHLRSFPRMRPVSVGYLDTSHVIHVDYGRVQVDYFAPFSSQSPALCARVQGPRDLLARWGYRWDAGEGKVIQASLMVTGTRYFLFFLRAPGDPCPDALPALLQRVRSGENLVNTELDRMRQVYRRCGFPLEASPDEQKVLRQCVSVLKMAQVSGCEPDSRSRGQVVACLPPGDYNVAWVRDGFYSVMAMIRLGMHDEARRFLEFELRADSGHYVHLKDKRGREAGVGEPYQISVCRYFGNGSEESFSAGDSGPNIELDGFGLFLTAFSTYVRSSGDEKFYRRYLSLVRARVATPLLHSIAPNGLVRPDSGPWERYLEFKQFTYTSVVCAQGLKDFADLQQVEQEPFEAYRQAALGLKQQILTQLVTPSGWLKGNVEARDPNAYDSHDGGTFEAFATGLLSAESLFSSQLAEYQRVLRVPGRERGYARINQGDSYETAEWVLLDLRIASAFARQGRPAEAADLIGWVTRQACRNFHLIPELYRRDNWAYDGAIPMVGFGAGAYILSELDLHPRRAAWRLERRN